jgi:uncharacterized protein (TIGR02453 family)
MTMAFRGWPAEAVEFYEGLLADNSRTYWQDHKATYENSVRAPMEALLAELADEFGAAKIFRPNRDVRFSADKSPYKTAIGALLDRGGYVQFSADGLAAGCGMYTMSNDQLERFRRAVDDNRTGTALANLVAAIRKPVRVTAREELKSAPRGYPADHLRIELLRRKGLITWQEWEPGAWLATSKPKAYVTKFLRTSRPIMDWLDEHVGPPR